MNKEGILQPVDEDLKRLAKTILRTTRFGALASIEPGTGVPLASRISCSTDMDGSPIFLISSLASHFSALEVNEKCSILLGEPGKGDPLVHPRITVIGKAIKVTQDARRTQIKKRFLNKHPKAALYADFGDFAFWYLDVERASLNGGFGKTCKLTKSDLLIDMSNYNELKAYEAGAVEHMNEDHLDAIHLYATKLMNQADGTWKLASIDPEGMDLVNGDYVQRYWFDKPLQTLNDLRQRLVELAKQARNL